MIKINLSKITNTYPIAFNIKTLIEQGDFTAFKFVKQFNYQLADYYSSCMFNESATRKEIKNFDEDIVLSACLLLSLKDPGKDWAEEEIGAEGTLIKSLIIYVGAMNGVLSDLHEQIMNSPNLNDLRVIEGESNKTIKEIVESVMSLFS